MGRAPCCDKMGLKKSPWTAQEDLTLVAYINRHGHGNWRNLPKHAGLLRCGKSCRLRWMNYLRPDIKRGNFTEEEEETIIKLQQELGNRWSVIAARLPGRTDNEIKNVWHTNLKKKLRNSKSQPEPETRMLPAESSDADLRPHSSSEVSSLTAATMTESLEDWPEVDDSFWSEVFSGDDSSATSDFSAGNSDFGRIQVSESDGSDLVTEGSMEFWYNLFNRAEEDLIELPYF